MAAEDKKENKNKDVNKAPSKRNEEEVQKLVSEKREQYQT